MIIPEDRQMAIDLINEAVTTGARQHKACKLIEISTRTLCRWQQQLKEEQSLKDRRKDSAASRTPANKLSKRELELIIKNCNQLEYQSLPPYQIVPILADKGGYMASESSFYRVLEEADQLNRRGRAEAQKIFQNQKDTRLMVPTRSTAVISHTLRQLLMGASTTST